MTQIEIIDRAVKSVFNKKYVLNINNIVQASLFFPGGTAEEKEVEKYLKDNLFQFKAGFILFRPLKGYVYINYSRPLSVENDFNFTYRVMKTKIKAAGGYKGLKQFVQDNSTIEDTFFFTLNGVIRNYEEKFNRLQPV